VARAALAVRSSGRWLLPTLLAGVLLGVHATHLPLLTGRYAARAGEPECATTVDGGVHGGHRPASGEGRPAGAGSGAPPSMIPPGALHSTVDGIRCPAETLAAAPRPASTLVLVLGSASLVAVVLAGEGFNRPVAAPLPPPDRRRALLQVYLL
jgi:hypothetical protein